MGSDREPRYPTGPEKRHGGVEHQREKRVGRRASGISGTAGEIRPVRRTDHAVPETVGCGAKLNRHEGVPRKRRVEAITLLKDVVYQVLADDLRQVLVDQ